jgi:hypothetical protein
MQALSESLLIPQIPTFDYSAQKNVCQSGALRILPMYSLLTRSELMTDGKSSPVSHAIRPVRAFAFGCEAGRGDCQRYQRCRIVRQAASSIGRSIELHKTYAPVDIEAGVQHRCGPIAGPPYNARRERKEAKSLNFASNRSLNRKVGAARMH